MPPSKTLRVPEDMRGMFSRRLMKIVISENNFE